MMMVDGGKGGNVVDVVVVVEHDEER